MTQASTQVRIQPVVMENRRILFRNFSGLEGKYNNKGNRNFCVTLTDEEAEAMERDGWNVKWLLPREEGDAAQAYLKVRVKFPDPDSKARPPRVIMITSRGKTPLDESMVSILDWAEITNVDLIFRAWQYDIGGRQGLSAYLNAIYVTIREDELEKKYADVPDSAASSLEVHEGSEKPPWDE